MCVTGAVVIFRQPALLWSSGGIRGTPQGFLAGCGSWGITGVADILATWYCRSSRTWSLDSVAGINTAPPSSTYQVWGMVRAAFAQGRGSSALPFSCVWALGVRKTATNEIHTGIHNIYIYIYLVWRLPVSLPCLSFSCRVRTVRTNSQFMGNARAFGWHIVTAVLDNFHGISEPC